MPCFVTKSLAAAVLIAGLTLPAQPGLAQANEASAQASDKVEPKPTNPAMPLYTSFEVIERLQEGGLVMLIRHERTEYPSRADDYTKPATECRAQRNLSVAGVVAAYENGTLLRAADIPVSRVITSPMCRAAETARFMFGVDYETDARLMHHDPGEESNRPLNQASKETKQVISELTSLSGNGKDNGIGDGNVAIISHGGNIFKSTGLRLTEGEIGVLQVNENGEITVLGQFTGSTLGFYVRMRQAEETAE